MTSLTRAEAQRRAGHLAVRSYDVALDLTGGDETFSSRTTIRFDARDPGADTFLDVRPAELRSVTLDGRSLDVSALRDGRLPLAGLAARNELVVDATMRYSHDGEGLHRHRDPADGRSYLYAMSFLDAAPRWFACFDQPDLKAPVTLDVRVPSGWLVAGNGAAAEIEPGRWRVASAGPLATYFTTLVAGPYHAVHDEHDGIPLTLLARRSLAEPLERDAEALLAHTARCFDELHRLFARRYPWGPYTQAFVPEFNAGAMENPACVTVRDDLLFRGRSTDAERADRDVFVAHEMAHMWFGDLVTMRWWDDLWLNESFAEYLGQRVCAAAGDARSWVSFGIARKSWGYAADRRPSTHPVAGNGADDAQTALNDFDGISYAKGASSLRQLAARLGDDAFLGGLRAYIAEHAHGNAELADLTAAWTAAGAAELPAWVRSWLGTSGLDTLAVRDGRLHRSGEGREHAIAVAGLAADGRELWRERVLVDADTVVLPRSDAPLVLPDAGDETWAKVALEPSAWPLVPGVLRGTRDPAVRVALWNALRLAVADAELDPAVALEVVTSTLPDEPVDAVIATVGRWASGSLVGAYLGRSEASAALARAVLAAAEGAEAGGSRQLALVRVAVAASHDTGWLRALADGGGPDGVEVDVELRWTVLERLAELGAADEDEIAAAAAADASSQGAEHATRCRVLRPDASAKAAAWQRIMRDPDVANHELYAAAGAFWRAGQEALTEPYVQRYFAEIAGTARLRSGWVVNEVAARAYPWTAVTQSTLDASDALLASPGLAPGIRRSVVDGADDLRRALAARERYGR